MIVITTTIRVITEKWQDLRDQYDSRELHEFITRDNSQVQRTREEPVGGGFNKSLTALCSHPLCPHGFRMLFNHFCCYNCRLLVVSNWFKRERPCGRRVLLKLSAAESEQVMYGFPQHNPSAVLVRLSPSKISMCGAHHHHSWRLLLWLDFVQTVDMSIYLWVYYLQLTEGGKANCDLFRKPGQIVTRWRVRAFQLNFK